jgi:hypothetical protein
VFQRESAARTELRLVAGRQFYRQSCGYCLRNIGRQHGSGCGTQVHAGVFCGAMRVLRQVRFFGELPDLYLQRIMIPFEPVCSHTT